MYKLMLIMAFMVAFTDAMGKTTTLNGVESIDIATSVDALADQCTIKVPGQVYNKPFEVEKHVKRGDAVTVKLGYGADLRTEFRGYVRAVYPNSPMSIECEDAIFLFRRPVKSKVFRKTNSTAIAKYVVAEINKTLKPEEQVSVVTDGAAIDFTTFSISRVSGYEVLDKLKQETGLAINTRTDGGKHELHLSLAYTAKTGAVRYDFAKNIEADSDLQYVRKDEIKQRVKVIGRTTKGAKIEVERGLEGGDVRTFQCPTISDKASLEKRAENELKKLGYDGYRGTIKAWLIPLCAIGYSATVVDVEYPEREGTYYVNAVKTEFSSAGGRRTVTLGVRLSAERG